MNKMKVLLIGLLLLILPSTVLARTAGGTDYREASRYVNAALVNSVDDTAGTYTEIIDMSLVRNGIFQYKLIAGTGVTLELQFWGTVYPNSVNTIDTDWVNITEFMSGSTSIIATNETIHALSIVDTNSIFNKIKLKWIVTVGDDNTVKIGWNHAK